MLILLSVNLEKKVLLASILSSSFCGMLEKEDSGCILQSDEYLVRTCAEEGS